MAVDEPDVIDMMSETKTGHVVLTVSGHLDWRDSLHQYTLQEKLNRYLAFVESGEILKQRPDAAARPIVIQVVCKHEPDAGGRDFLQRACSAIEQAGFEFQYEFFGHQV
jgi:uncharacterized protein DUF6572